MPALSSQRRGAQKAAQTKKTAATARSQAQDSDYEDDPSGDESRAAEAGPPVAGLKRRELTNEQLDSRKRRREEHDILHPAAPTVKGPSRSTLWRESKGITKKARAKMGQMPMDKVFKPAPARTISKAKTVASIAAPAKTLFAFWSERGVGASGAAAAQGCLPDATPVTALSATHQSLDLDTDGLELIEQPAPLVGGAAEWEPMDIDAVEGIQRAGDGAAENAATSSAAGDVDADDGYSTAEGEDEESGDAFSRASIEGAHRLLVGKIKQYRRKHCGTKAMAGSGSNAKMAGRVVLLNGLDMYAAEVQRLSLKKLKQMEALRFCPAWRRKKQAQRIQKLRPRLAASRVVAARFAKSEYWAGQLRSAAVLIVKTGELPENEQGKGAKHKTHIDNPDVKSRAQRFLKKEIPVEKGGLVGRVRPEKLRRYINEFVFPELEIEDTICLTTATTWLRKLGYQVRRYAKGIYYDGHEREDVVKARNEFIDFMEKSVLPFAYQYETVVNEETGEKSLQEIAPTIPDGGKILYPIYHDETSVHANDQAHFIWETEDEHELRSKSRGRIVHVSGFIVEHCGRLRLTPDEIEREEALPKRPLSPAELAAEAARAAEAEKRRLEEEQRATTTTGRGNPKKGAGGKKGTDKQKAKTAPATDRTTGGAEWTPPPPPSPFTRYRCDKYDADRIIYPGAKHDPWWDMPQLIDQTKDALDIFEAKYPDGRGVFIFDCSSAHEAYASDALLAHKMNRGPGGKVPCMHETIIPGTTRRQSMVFKEGDMLPVDKDNKPIRSFIGQPKGMELVLKERGLLGVLEQAAGRPSKVVAVCADCSRSQKARDAEAKARREGGEEAPSGEEAEEFHDDDKRPTTCCMQRLLSVQDDFKAEKPLLQLLIEKRGHICLFLPRFHCELNPIEMVWAEMKRRFRERADGTFPTAKKLVPECLDAVSLDTIRRFFRHCNRYRDAYRYGLNPRQAAYAVKKYSSHRRVPRAILGDINILSRQ
ncbi:DDE family endonuclease [Mycena kentingensis (nom. inval.)]|nr:DDE family endonuclease [Mycena kentingensis (nom. inval.)]